MNRLKVDFHTEKYRGPRSSTIRVISNDPDIPITILKIFIDIKVQVIAEPSRISFGKIDRAKLPEEEVFVYAEMDKPLDILEIKSEPERFIYEITDHTQGSKTGKLVKLKFDREKKLKIGRLWGLIKIKTNSEKQPFLNLKYYSFGVEGVIKIAPQQVFLRSFGNDEYGYPRA